MNKLLKTKYMIPLVKSNYIKRKNIIEKMNRYFDNNNNMFSEKLSTIIAPGGYGKTTFAYQLIKNLNSNISWVNLDEDDNDLKKFWSYIIASISLKFSVINQNLSGFFDNNNVISPDNISTDFQNSYKSLIINFINEIIELQEKIVLVLDDYHKINNKFINESMDFFIDNLPNNMHIIIISREQLGISLRRLIFKNQLIQINEDELKFDNDETEEFLKTIVDLDLNKEDINQLVYKTEGWITGIKLITLTTDKKNTIYDNFKVSKKYVSEYLIEEIISHKPDYIQKFIVITSILKEFNEKICNEILDIKNSKEIIEELEKSNLFINSIDEEKNWFRYHNLFREYLFEKALKIYKNDIKKYYDKIAHWYENNRMFKEAIEYYIESENMNKIKTILQKEAINFINSGRKDFLKKNLDLIPNESIIQNIELSIIKSLVEFIYGDLKKSIYYINNIESEISNKKNEINDEIFEMLYIVKTYLSIHSGDFMNFKINSEKAKNFITKNSKIKNSLIDMLLADIYTFSGEYKKAEFILENNINYNIENNHNFFTLVSAIKIIRILLYRGELSKAEFYCKEHLKIANEKGFSKTSRIALLHSVLAEIYCEKNNKKKAFEEIKKARSLSISENNNMIQILTNMSLVKILYYYKNYHEALNTIEKNNEIIINLKNSKFYTYMNSCWKARILYKLDNKKHLYEKSLDILNNVGINTEMRIEYFKETEYITLIKILIKLNRIKEAENFIEKLEKFYNFSDFTRFSIEINICKSLLNEKQELSFEYLKKAVIDSEKEKHIILFHEDETVIEKVKKLYYTNYLKYYTKLILEDLNLDSNSESELLFEQLSEREREVLRYIAEGKTNKEISEILFVSLSTIKWHSVNIYGKLNVGNRLQAINRAKQLKII